eukprot:2655248-Prymnesium_polylepis.2
MCVPCGFTRVCCYDFRRAVLAHTLARAGGALAPKSEAILRELARGRSGVGQVGTNDYAAATRLTVEGGHLERARYVHRVVSTAGAQPVAADRGHVLGGGAVEAELHAVVVDRAPLLDEPLVQRRASQALVVVLDREHADAQRRRAAEDTRLKLLPCSEEHVAPVRCATAHIITSARSQ